MKNVLHFIVLCIEVLLFLCLFTVFILIIASVTLFIAGLSYTDWIAVGFSIYSAIFIILSLVEIFSTYIELKKHNTINVLSKCFKGFVSIGICTVDIPVLYTFIATALLGAPIVFVLAFFM